MPVCPSVDDDKTRYYAKSYFEHMVYDYSGIPMDEQEDMLYADWLQLRFDAYVTSLNRTEEGRKYLENAYLYSQTEADRTGLDELRHMMGGG